jgi:cytochrome b6-f complex iron-sulfur subunit
MPALNEEAEFMDRLLHAETASARRRFLWNALIGAIGSSVAILGTGFAFLLWPRRSSAVRNKFVVGAEEIPAVNMAPYVNDSGRFYLVHTEDGLLALSWRCTHKGCRTLWQGPVHSRKAFECPCHASTFTYSGVNTAGPARRPFDLMKLAVNGDGSVTVNTESVSSRSDYSPTQAVSYPH